MGQIELKPDLITLTDAGDLCLEWFGFEAKKLTLWVINDPDESDCDPLLLLSRDGKVADTIESVFARLPSELRKLGRSK